MSQIATVVAVTGTAFAVDANGNRRALKAGDILQKGEVVQTPAGSRVELLMDDGKVLAVPTNKVLAMYSAWKNIEDVNPARLKALSHFFEHYKDLEEGKWVKVLGWEGIESAHKEIIEGLANYAKAHG